MIRKKISNTRLSYIDCINLLSVIYPVVTLFESPLFSNSYNLLNYKLVKTNDIGFVSKDSMLDASI